jgi:hypothetical protein
VQFAVRWSCGLQLQSLDAVDLQLQLRLWLVLESDVCAVLYVPFAFTKSKRRVRLVLLTEHRRLLFVVIANLPFLLLASRSCMQHAAPWLATAIGS